MIPDGSRSELGLTHQQFHALIKDAFVQASEQVYPQLYPDSVYRQSDGTIRQCHHRFEGNGVKSRQACIASTNALMKIIRAEFVDPLSQITPELHIQVRLPVMDPSFVTKVNAVLARLESLGPPADEQKIGTGIQSARGEFWSRTINLMYSQFTTLTSDMAKYLERQRSITRTEAAYQLCARPKASIADTLACQAIHRIYLGTLTGND